MKEKEIPLEERIEQIFESGWVNEFNYLENLMQETRSCLYKLQQELQKKDNIINAIKEELNKDFNTYVCKNKSYGKIFKAGAEIYKEHLLYKIKELENDH